MRRTLINKTAQDLPLNVANVAIWILGMFAQPFTFLATNVWSMWYRNAAASTVLLICWYYYQSTTVHTDELTSASRSRGTQSQTARHSPFIDWPMWAKISSAIACGFVLLVASHIGYGVVSMIFPNISDAVGALYARVNTQPGLPGVLLLLPIAVVAEELFWRQVVLDKLLRVSSVRDGSFKTKQAMPILISAALYAVTVASSGSIILVIAALCLGVFWGVQKMMTGTLLVPVITHLIWNAGLFFVWPV